MPLSRRSWSRFALATAVLASVGCRLKSTGTPVASEASAPDFTLADQDGREDREEDYDDCGCGED